MIKNRQNLNVNKQKGNLYNNLANISPPVFAFFILIIFWEIAARMAWVPRNMLPAPTLIIEQGIKKWRLLAIHSFTTLKVTLIGFSLSVIVAFIVSCVLDFSEIMRKAILPLLIVSQTIPIIALAPLVILWFGFGLFPKILLVAFVTFFPMVVGLLQGFELADYDAQQLLRTMNASKAKIFWYVRLPGAMPSFFASLKISITYAVVGAIFAEYAGAVEGLGVYMLQAKNLFRTDLVLAAVIVTSVLTLLLFALVVLIERISAPWIKIEFGGGEKNE